MSTVCPECGSAEVYSEEHQDVLPRRTREGRVIPGVATMHHECQKCGHEWTTRRADRDT